MLVMRVWIWIMATNACLCLSASAQTNPAIDADALEALKTAAEAAHSDAVIALRDGDVIADWNFGVERHPIETMSVLKSVVAVAMGRLVALGKIEGLDQPVHELYPEWKQGQKKLITIRQLMNHTSGLQDNPNAGAEIYPSPNAVSLALAAELTEEPGSTFRYNNKATNLLSGVIEVADGRRMDRFMVDELFAPMGIEKYEWYYDKSGTPHAMAGLQLLAHDLAKFGRLMLDDGVWEGNRLLPEGFVDQLIDQSQPHYAPYGLLWWRLPESTKFILDDARMSQLESADVDPSELARLRPLVGRAFDSRLDRDQALEAIYGSDWRSIVSKNFVGTGVDPVFRRQYGEIVAYYGDGYLGQTLLVIPQHRIVAVRQVKRDDDYDSETDLFPDFKKLVLNLVTDQ